jgi:hypothetical protein
MVEHEGLSREKRGKVVVVDAIMKFYQISEIYDRDSTIAKIGHIYSLIDWVMLYHLIVLLLKLYRLQCLM